MTSVRWSLGASLGKNTLLPSEKKSIRKSLILRNMNLHIIQMHATLSRWTTTKDQFAPDKSSRTVNWTRSLRISNSQLMASQHENKANQCNLHLGRRKTQTNVLSLQMRSFYSIDGRTVFENLIKSLIQHCDCERSEQGLQYCQIGQFFKRTKLVKKARIQKFKWDCLSDFQTMCGRRSHSYCWRYDTCKRGLFKTSFQEDFF